MELTLIVAWFALLAACVAFVLAIMAFHRAIEAQIDVRALQKSTHQVQLVPVDSDDAMDEEQSSDAMAKAERLAMESLTLDGDQPLS